MTLRPSGCVVPLFVLLIAFLGILPLLLAFAELPRSLVFGAPLFLAGLPFALNFVRRLAWVWGARLELDEQGLTWSRGARTVRIEWTSVARVSHGRMEQEEWLLEDEGGRAISISGLWQSRGSELRSAFRRGIEDYLARMRPPERVVVRPSAFDLSLIPAGIGMLALFLGPLAWAAMTVPREFVPSTAFVATWGVVGVGVGAGLLGLTKAARWRMVVTSDSIDLPYRFGTRTLRLADATEIRHEVHDSFSGLVRLSTTIVHPLQTVVLASRQEGYLEARALLSREAVR